MKKNFLKVSKTYVERMTNASSPTDFLMLGDLVTRKFLGDDWNLKATRAEIEEEMEKQGLDMSFETLRRVIKQIDIARKWLLSDEKGRADCIDYLNKLSRGYGKFLRIGIDCLIADGIETWEQVEELITIEMKAELTADAEAPPVLPIDDFAFLVQEAETRLESSTRILHTMKQLYFRDHEELVECLDELKNLESLIAEIHQLKRLLKEREEQIAELKNQLQKAIEERNDLWIEHEKELKEKEDLEEEVQNLSEDSLIRRLLAAVERAETSSSIPKSLPQEQLPEKNENGSVLPSRYCPIPVHYQQSFLDALDDLSKKNKKLYSQVLKAIKRICELGIEKISNSKPLGETMKSPNTLPHSHQVKIRKWRLTVNVNGRQVIFCELFPRDKSPFSS